MTALALLAGKAALVLLAAGLAARAARRASPSVRHLLLLAGATGAVLLPALCALLPGWSAVPVAGTPEAGAGIGYLHSLLLVAWITGGVVLGLRLGRSWAATNRLVRNARDVSDATLLTAAIDARAEAGLHMPIRILCSRDVAAPVATGILRSCVLLPPAAFGWSRPRLRAVFLHEFAHLARRDCLTQLLAQLCCAVYWFLPPAWWNARAMRFHREVACDDRVVERGARPSRYAALLLGMFRSAGYAGALPVQLHAATALAAPHDMERRIGALLRRERGPRTGWRRAGGIILLTLVAVGTLAGLGEADPAVTAPSASPTHRHLHVSVSAFASAGGFAAVATSPRPPR